MIRKKRQVSHALIQRSPVMSRMDHLKILGTLPPCSIIGTIRYISGVSGASLGLSPPSPAR